MQTTLLYFNPSSFGGLADYAHEQANALALSGVAVEMLTTPQWPTRSRSEYHVRPVLMDNPKRDSKFIRKISWVNSTLRNFQALAREIKTGNYSAVLFGSYSEYLAPFWAGPLRKLARTGVKFGAVVHDPVRDYVVGPHWWHRRSIAAAYSFLQEAFVHEEIKLDTVRPMPALRTTVIPHGPFEFPGPTESQEKIRQKLSLPAEAFVLLSFGHIRDGKNLDLTIRALPELDSVYLVVAGKEQSSGQKSIGYYQDLAVKLGVQERCRWIHGHVPESDIGNLFLGADLILMTYSKNFRSASGVLNAAVRYRKPCVASSGSGNLRTVVERYQLGLFVEPDNFLALKNGIKRAMTEKIHCRWEDYALENSWQRNAQLVKERMFESFSQRPLTQPLS